MAVKGKARKRYDEIAMMRAWSQWNARSMREYMEALLRLPREERRRDRGASWGSLQDVFLHVVEDYLWWYETVPSKGSGAGKDLVGLDLSDEEIRGYVRRAESAARSVARSLRPSNLRLPVRVKGTVDGKPYEFTTCIADIVWHMLEEELQHRGEMNALFWQIGVDPPLRAWFSSPASVTK